MCSYVEASEFSFLGDRFTYKGYEIGTGLNVTPENYKIEGGVLTKVINNKFNNLKIIKIISQKGKVEVWIFNEAAKEKLLKLDGYLTDFHISWLSAQHLKVSRSHMGLSVTYVYKLNPPLSLVKKSKAIDGMLFFDPVKELFLRYAFKENEQAKDKIVLGEAFGCKEEIFEITFDYKYLSDAFGLIKSARVEKDLVILDVRQGKKTVTFKYQIGKGR